MALVWGYHGFLCFSYILIPCSFVAFQSSLMHQFVAYYICCRIAHVSMILQFNGNKPCQSRDKVPLTFRMTAHTCRGRGLRCFGIDQL
ncbi:hypothetical protein CONLIGDRAFT_418619 [Coniochaeta ligniaria NRRL 30616]|uniref:Uncharacterized protein n=1 Tax=Coniochaeta ligniaria NRRL 30616 TaxID=1408157 RepID=A0A1J7IHL5_9PEZI|nr:hypothetical protein CONLIGDRAFT_418619 [Coniochaeta ligniaria NRRL 30616]